MVMGGNKKLLHEPPKVMICLADNIFYLNGACK